jgi:hypothetical protein
MVATPKWTQPINFDGQVTGQTAQVIKQVAEDRGLTPQQILAELLHEAINGRGYGNPGRTEVDVKVEPMTINTGNGGFHVVTVVADGYGSLLAENSAGEERARVKIATDGTDDDPVDPQTDLVRIMWAFHAQAESERNSS